MNRFVAFLLLGLFLLVPVTSVSAEEQRFGGVGLQVVPTITGELVVLNVLEETPASEKGVLPGDLIFQVDDFPLQGSDFGVVVSEHLWGPVDSQVEIFYRRPGLAGVSRVVLKRSSLDPRLTVTPAVQNGSLKSAE
ncbi:MAG: PDZ domain-containing protein [Desulfuromonadales bacterium]|nr:PDZ domain-containing protein [Desulfuromonadales bacterium]MDH4023844.1 PDZ domain-containing protein [Desulfuromonadales bacterium]